VGHQLTERMPSVWPEETRDMNTKKEKRCD
jgi:hypothetical protein